MIQALYNIAALTTLGLAVGYQWGLCPALAAVSFAYIVMPFSGGK